MERLDRQSQPYTQFGEISAAGINKLLGTPRQSRLATAIRETVQNSWDARVSGVQPRYSVCLRTLTDAEKQALDEGVLGDRPPDFEHHRGIGEILSRKEIRCLDISDHGTSGLGGPVNPGEPPGEEPTDFVDFLRNIGSPRDKEFGAGTYGYGKTSLYRLSEAGTIVVHTHAFHRGKPVRRLMACRLGDRFDILRGKNKGRYTGRHWWGRLQGDLLAPAEGREADALARALGLPVRDGDPGTSIMVIEPVLGELTSERAASVIIETLLWNFWPKMIRHGRAQPAMAFSARLEGRKVEIPRVEDCPPLDLFASSMRELREGGGKVSEIRSHRPKKLLGHLHMKAHIRGARRDLGVGEDSVIPDVCGHVALMRPAELVVKYLEGRPLEFEHLEWAGVFVCSEDEDVEKAFAESEPPAHDDWEPANLPETKEGRRRKSYVQVALRRVRDAMDEFAAPTPPPPPPEDGGSVGRLADMLGKMLVDVPMGPGGEQGPRRKKGPRSRKLHIATVSFLEHDCTNGEIGAVFEIRISGKGTGVLHANPGIVLEGGGVDPEGPDGRRLQVDRWLDSTGALLGGGPSLQVDVRGDLTIRAVVPVPGYVAVTLVPTLEVSGA